MKLIIRFLMIFCLLLVGADGYSLFANPNVVSYPPADSYNITVSPNLTTLTGISSTNIRPASYEVSREDETAVSADEDEDEDEGFSFKKSLATVSSLPAYKLQPAVFANCHVSSYSSFHRHFAYLSSTRYILYRVIRI